jgi:hypothetical protein
MSADIIGDKTRGNNMRVTNSMISNSASAHITNAKNSLLKYSDQYTTQKKIQRPSDDPTVAVRSLKQHIHSLHSMLRRMFRIP